MSRQKRGSPYIDYKELLEKDFQDLCQQHQRYGQAGLCDCYCDEGSAGKNVHCSQVQFGRYTWD